MTTVRQYFDRLSASEADPLASVHDRAVEHVNRVQESLLAEIDSRLRDGRELPRLEDVRAVLEKLP